MKRFGVVTVFAAVVLTGCGGGSEPEAKSKPKTFEVAGTMTLTSADVIGDGGDGCLGSGGYDDIRAGAPVVVFDSKGDKVGIGELRTGSATSTVTCVLPFTVPDVPDKGTIFSIEVANRGETPFKRSDSRRVAVALG